MKIKLLSDLHLEGRQGYHKKEQPWAQYNGEDVLVLAGDIAVGADAVSTAFAYFKALGFKEIVYVPGNHEYYHYDRNEHEAIKAVARVMKVHFLDANEIVKIQDVSFFGGTLWTNFGNDNLVKLTAKNYINDFKVIKNWTPDDAVKEYIRQSDFIKTAIRQTEGKKCVVTHFLPAQEAVAERFKSNSVVFLLNKYFANSLDHYLSTISNTTWMFGHTHDAMDFYIGETRLISNPLGYPNEFVPEHARHVLNKIIEL